MNEYSGHYDQSFDPRPKCPEPGCDKLMHIVFGDYVHVEPKYQGSRPE